MSFAVAAAAFTSATILAYYLYIPRAEIAVKKAPMLLSQEK